MATQESPWLIDKPGDVLAVRIIHKAGCEVAGETVPADILANSDEETVRQILADSPYHELCPECLPDR